MSPSFQENKLEVFCPSGHGQWSLSRVNKFSRQREAEFLIFLGITWKDYCVLKSKV